MLVVLGGVAAVIFRLFDVDKDDYISVEDLNKVLGLMVGTEMSPAALAAVVAATMEAADIDRDGRISYDDFEAVSARPRREGGDGAGRGRALSILHVPHRHAHVLPPTAVDGQHVVGGAGDPGEGIIAVRGARGGTQRVVGSAGDADGCQLCAPTSSGRQGMILGFDVVHVTTVD